MQIDEARSLSPALTGTFLPRRKIVLEAFINGQCVHTTAGDPQPDGDLAGDGLTIGGSPVGAAN